VYPDCPIVSTDCPIVFATTGASCGGPGVAPDCLAGKARRFV
jgi:hypothetical protein